MAKRSVKRARQHERQRGGKPHPQPAAPPARRSRPFWLGAVAAAALLVPLAIVAVVIAAGGDDDAGGGAASAQEAIQSEAARLERESLERDRQQVQELTQRMARMLGELGPAVRGLARTVPPGRDQFGPMADAAAVDRWSRAAREAAAYFEDPPSGETQTNVARLSFGASVDGLIGAIETYRIALTDSAHRRQLLARVRAQRDLAVQTWFAGGTELDAVNHKHGFGHHHIYLAPEGSGVPGPDGG